MEILYVDDDSEDRELFTTAVKDIDPKISLTNFSRAKDLLNHLNVSSTVPDYIFIDINMPAVDGRECARQIRSNEKFSDSRIVMYSTTSRPADLENFQEQKFQFVKKSDQYGHMIASIKDVIKKPNIN